MYPDIFESANFSFRILFPSTRILWIRQMNPQVLNKLSRVEIFEYVMNPESCGR